MSMISSNSTKILLISVWLAVIIVLLVLFIMADIPLNQYTKIILSFIKGIGFFGPLLYIGLFALRGFFVYPSVFLITSAGFLFGPTLGVIYSIIGENIAAIIAFILIRYLGRSLVQTHKHGKLIKLDNYLKSHGFIATLILRLIYIPFDVVNISCGLSEIKIKDYFLATLIGTTPLILTLVLLGSSFTNPVNLLFTGLILVTSLIASYILHKKHKHLIQNSNAETNNQTLQT